MNDRRRNTFRIDYDKLAEAIVKAQLEANQKTENDKPDNKYANGFMKIFVEIALWGFIVSGILFFFGNIAYYIHNKGLYTIHTFEGWQYIILTIEFFIISIIVTIYSGLTLKEVEHSNDNSYISSMFSNMIAFVALIVTTIALFK